MDRPVVSARQVHVRFAMLHGTIHAVRGVDLEIAPGETVALVGESGSGKSAFAKAFLRLHQPPFTPPRTRIEGEIWLDGPGGPIDLVAADKAQLRAVRANHVGMVFQDALSALNPVARVGHQVKEALRSAYPAFAPSEIRDEVLMILERIGLPDPESRARAFPHQLSGGQCQRVVIAIAAIRRPRLLIADEPTTALDVTVQARLLKLLKEIQRASGMAMLFITHDLGIVAEIADRVAVMKDGEVAEIASTRDLFERPRHPHTATLIASLAGRRNHTRSDTLPAQVDGAPPAVVLKDVSMTFAGSTFRRAPQVQALEAVSLIVRRGERLGIVGESGSGKTTLGRVVLGLQPPTTGSVLVGGEDPFRRSHAQSRAFCRRVQVVFQDAASALDPRMSVGASIREGLDIHRLGNPIDRTGMVAAALAQVGLDADIAERYPHMLSGGQRQRVNIARSLVLRPEILVADEPVSALDMSIQAQILDLLNKLHADLGLTMLFITHDLWVVREFCDRVAVIKDGRIVEVGPTERVFAAPSHAYTRLLLAGAFGTGFASLDQTPGDRHRGCLLATQ